MRTTKKQWIVLAMALLAGVAQSKEKVRWEPGTEKEEIVRWELRTVNGKPVKYAEEQQPITLQMNHEAGTIRGEAGCNSYYGNYTLGKISPSMDGTVPVQEVTFSPTLPSETECPEAFMKLERKYMSLLEKVNGMMMTEKTLILYQNDKEVMKMGRVKN